MKRIALAAALCTVLGASSAQADDRTWLGAAVGAQTVPRAMLGDTHDVVTGLGLRTELATIVRLVPRITVGFDFDPGGTLGLDVSGSWFADSVQAKTSTPIRYEARRDVVPVTALLRYAPHKGNARMVLGAGPTIALSRFSESGWLGDGTETSVAPGGRLHLGGRHEIDGRARFWYGVDVQWLYLPRKNTLLADGGGAFFGGIELGLDWQL